MKDFKLNILFIALILFISCSKKGRITSMEVTVLDKSTISLDYHTGGKDTIRMRNEGIMNVFFVSIYNASDSDLIMQTKVYERIPLVTTLEVDNVKYGDIEYDRDGRVRKLEMGPFIVTQALNGRGEFMNEYEVTVKPTDSPHDFFIGVHMCCTKSKDYFAIPSDVIIY